MAVTCQNNLLSLKEGIKLVFPLKDSMAINITVLKKKISIWSSHALLEEWLMFYGQMVVTHIRRGILKTRLDLILKH